MRHTATILIVLATCPALAVAQTSATRPPVPQSQILSTNPFGLIFNWFNVEYERRVAPATTVGVSASHIAMAEHSNAALILRWYPQGAALDGFYLGGRAGAYAFETYDYEYPTYQGSPSDPSRRPYPIARRRTDVHPGVGLELGYNWRLGAKQNLIIGLGFGLTRIQSGADRDGCPRVLPNPRVVNIGFAF
jgi:hypothetical protein